LSIGFTDVLAVEVKNLCHSYGDKPALKNISFEVNPGEIYGLVGPNGGGKSTTFRILSTLMAPTAGSARVFSHDVTAQAALVRQDLGIVFQSAGLDKKLTVKENLMCQGYLYGIDRKELPNRVSQAMEKVRVTEYQRQPIEKLSGGLKRRVEIAKSWLHDARLLLLDEPTTGLDPGARRDVWEHLETLRRERGVTIVVTTHLMDEAERCERIALIHCGEIVTVGRPAELCEQVGGEVISLRSRNPQRLQEVLRENWGLESQIIGDEVRIERQSGPEWVARLMTQLSDDIVTLTVGRPTLEDFFIKKTGARMEVTT